MADGAPALLPPFFGPEPKFPTGIQRGRHCKVCTALDPKFTVTLLTMDGETKISYDSSPPPFLLMWMVVSPVALPITRMTRGDCTVTSAIFGFATETTVAGWLSSITCVLLMSTLNFWAVTVVGKKLPPTINSNENIFTKFFNLPMELFQFIANVQSLIIPKNIL